MSVNINGTSGNNSVNATASYNVVYVSSSTIKVDVNYQTSQGTEALTVWVNLNGTVVGVNDNGYNLTGSEGSDMTVGLFFAFVIEADTSTSIPYFNASSQWESVGTSQVTLGPTTMTVTNYQFSSYPVTITSCSSSETFSAFSVSIGTPPGTSYQLITKLYEAGDFSGTQGEYSIEITSITVG